MSLNQQRLRELLSYDRQSGEFTWLVNRGGTARAGSVAGRISFKGYRQISIDCKMYYAHRLAWFYVQGSWPEAYIDHIDLNKLNNRISNLREATRSENKANTLAMCNNTSGHKGVTWNKQAGKWIAQIRHQGKFIYLGIFIELEDAAAAYAKAAIELFGEFYRVE